MAILEARALCRQYQLRLRSDDADEHDGAEPVSDDAELAEDREGVGAVDAVELGGGDFSADFSGKIRIEDST